MLFTVQDRLIGQIDHGSTLKGRREGGNFEKIQNFPDDDAGTSPGYTMPAARYEK